MTCPINSSTRTKSICDIICSVSAELSAGMTVTGAIAALEREFAKHGVPEPRLSAQYLALHALQPGTALSLPDLGRYVVTALNNMHRGYIYEWLLAPDLLFLRGPFARLLLLAADCELQKLLPYAGL